MCGRLLRLLWPQPSIPPGPQAAQLVFPARWLARNCCACCFAATAGDSELPEAAQTALPSAAATAAAACRPLPSLLEQRRRHCWLWCLLPRATASYHCNLQSYAVSLHQKEPEEWGSVLTGGSSGGEAVASTYGRGACLKHFTRGLFLTPSAGIPARQPGHRNPRSKGRRVLTAVLSRLSQHAKSQ